jgi:DNA repair exonuclease SbcCD nuclease subunit
MIDSDCFRILIAMEIRIGENESHTIRSLDSFEALSEVMQIAKANKPDFLLLSCNLFDNINPL